MSAEPAYLLANIPDLYPASGFLAGNVGVPSIRVYGLVLLYLSTPTIFLENAFIFPLPPAV